MSARRLRWFEFATTCADSVSCRLTPLGKWFAGTSAIAGIFSADPSRTHAYLLFTGSTAALLVAFLMSLWQRPRLSAHRLLPGAASRLSPCTYTLAIRNDGQSVLTGLLVRDRLRTAGPTVAAFEDAASGNSPDNWFDRRTGYRRWQRLRVLCQGASIETVHINNLTPAERRHLQLTLIPLRRGPLEFVAVDIALPEPLGLCYSLCRVRLQDSLLSRPPSIPLPDGPLPASDSHSAGSSPVQVRGDGMEFFALRDYRVGDPPKLIDWRSFAKRRLPVVRQYVAEQASPALLVLDTSLESGRQADFEDLMVVAASLVMAALPGGRSAPELAVIRPPEATLYLAGGVALMDVLALLTPTGRDALEACRQCVALARSDRGICYLTAAWDAARAQFANELATRRGWTITIVVGHAALRTAGADVLALKDVAELPHLDLMAGGRRPAVVAGSGEHR